MIVRARVVVTMDGPPIENGAVLVSGNRVVAVGKFSEIKKLPSPAAMLSTSPSGRGSRVAAGEGNSTIVDLGEQVLLPGLINAHCHLDYTCLRGKIARQKSFTAWIQAINFEKAKLSTEDYVASIDAGFLEAKRFGTTTIANLTAFPELVSRIRPPMRTWWFAELIDVRDPSRAREIVEIAVEQLKSQEHWGLAPHAPFTASADLYRRCEQIAPVLTTHLAESREEMSMFRDASGELYEFLKKIGRDMTDCGKETAFANFVHRFEIDPPLIVAHLNELAESDLTLLRREKPPFHIVHCPRSHGYFGHSDFQFQKLRELGFNVCLGTDSLASNDDLSLLAEMRTFKKEFPTVLPEEILKMVTLNSALALGKPHVLGRIRKNYWADLIAVPIEKSDSIVENIIGFDRPVSWTMAGGRILT